MGHKRLQAEIDEFKYQGEKTPLTFGAIVVLAFCFLMMILSTFTEIDLIRVFPAADGSGFLVSKFIYVAQIPVFIFVVVLLGVRYSVFAMVLYLILGLFGWRIFAYGGGIGYLKYCAFGYLLGFIPCALVVGFLRKKFEDKWYQNLLSALGGVFSIYITGFLYSFALFLLHIISIRLFVAEAVFPSKTKLLYDLLFSIFAIYTANPIKNILWVAIKSPFKRKIKNKNLQENS